MARRAPRKPLKRGKGARSARLGKKAVRSVKRPSRKRLTVKAASTKRARSKAKGATSKAKGAKSKAKALARKSPRPTTKAASPTTSVVRKTARLDRVRRTLDETVPTPPSSLNLDRRPSAARSGRAEMAESLAEHRGMSPAITAGDVDVDVEDAYFTGDEAPGGDNPTPDQDIVDDIGKALGVQYGEGEELKSTDKITERDRHRWEMDPASSEDYKDRK